MRCPCRKVSETLSYERCCGPYHAGERVPETAEALMRSRFAAFAMADAPYLTATWHPTTRPARLDFQPGLEWTRLRIVAAREDGDAATVEFVAKGRIGGSAHELHEVSRFVRQGGRWYYVDGLILPPHR